MSSPRGASSSWAAAGWAALLVAWGVSRAAAQPALELRWQAPPECPGQEAVVAEVRALLAGGTRAAAPPAVEVTVRPRRGRYHASLHLVRGRSRRKRELSAQRCEELAEAVALIVALAIDPGVRVDRTRVSTLRPPQAPEGEPAAPTERAAAPQGGGADAPSSETARAQAGAQGATDAAPPPKAPEPDLGAPEAHQPVAWEAGAEASVEGWTLPQVAASAGLWGALRWGWLRVALAARLTPPRRYAGADGSALRAWSVDGSLWVGVQRVRPNASWILEGGLRVQRLSARAEDADERSWAHALMLSPQLGAGLQLPLGPRWGAAGGLRGGAQLRRPRLQVVNRGLVHQPARGWLAGSIGFFVQLR